MGAPDLKKKTRTISLRVTDEQYESINELIKIIHKKTGTRVTKSSLILKLIQYGRPIIEGSYLAEQTMKIKKISTDQDDDNPLEKKKFLGLF